MTPYWDDSMSCNVGNESLYVTDEAVILHDIRELLAKLVSDVRELVEQGRARDSVRPPGGLGRRHGPGCVCDLGPQ